MLYHRQWEHRFKNCSDANYIHNPRCEKVLNAPPAAWGCLPLRPGVCSESIQAFVMLQNLLLLNFRSVRGSILRLVNLPHVTQFNFHFCQSPAWEGQVNPLPAPVLPSSWLARVRTLGDRNRGALLVERGGDFFHYFLEQLQEGSLSLEERELIDQAPALV
jgi:hypothetical protein